MSSHGQLKSSNGRHGVILSKPQPKHKPVGARPKTIPTTTDRISRLPDHLLHHILYFLPLKQAGRTSILSHRWRHVWASMQNLKFYMDEFAKFGPDKFISYVNAALPHRRKQDFRDFKTFLLSDSPANLATSTRWISHAVKNDVQVLCIIIRPQNSGGNVILPRSVLLSPLLEELSLSSFPNPKIITPSILSLTQLRILNLQRMNVNSIFLGKIFSGCPRLETLNLHFCEISFSRVYSMALRNLVMEDCRILTKRKNKFHVYAPNLLHLHFKQDCGTLLYHETLDEMFKLDVPNLKSLILGGNWIARYPDAIPFFLRHSPMLEKLIVNYYQCLGEVNVLQSVNNPGDLCFQCQNLNSVEIICYEADKKLSHVINVLKRNGICNLKFSEDYSSILSDCLKMLFDVWVWTNNQMIEKKFTQPRRRSFRLQ